MKAKCFLMFFSLNVFFPALSQHIEDMIKKAAIILYLKYSVGKKPCFALPHRKKHTSLPRIKNGRRPSRHFSL